MKQTIFAVISVETEEPITDADLAAGLSARLDEFYPTDDGMPLVPMSVGVAVTTPEVAEHIRGVLGVGLGNEDEVGDAALTVCDHLFDGKTYA